MEIIDAFYAARNSDNAPAMAAYMKNQFSYLGIKTPERRELAKSFLKKRSKDAEIDWVFIWHCWQLPEREFQYLALSYLGRVEHLLTPDDAGSLEKLITTKSWWDTVDTISSFIGALALRYPEVKQTVIEAWCDSGNIWLKRISIIFQLRSKAQTDTDFLSRAILRNTGTGEFFVNKGIGWALREYSKTNPDWVRDFIGEHRDTLSALSIREGGKYV